jgi:hypothetical protein
VLVRRNRPKSADRDVPRGWVADVLQPEGSAAALGQLAGAAGRARREGVVLGRGQAVTPQGILSGGKDTGWGFWGNAD